MSCFSENGTGILPSQWIKELVTEEKKKEHPVSKIPLFGFAVKHKAYSEHEIKLVESMSSNVDHLLHLITHGQILKIQSWIELGCVKMVLLLKEMTSTEAKKYLSLLKEKL